MMKRSTIYDLCLLLLLLWAAGCGGSGSSGFDIQPFNENAVIAEVLESGDCQSGEGVMICRASAGVEANPGTPSPTPSMERDVALILPAGDGLACHPATDGSNDCGLIVTFQPGSFPAANFRVAARTGQPPGSWIVSGQPSQVGTSFVVAIDLPPGSSAVQIAVLVFDAAFEPQAGPVEQLIDTGATSVFVSAALPLNPN